MVKTRRESLAERVGRNIAARRKQMNLRQDQLAEMLSVEPETISRFERAAHAPSLKTLEKIAQALSVSADTLLREERPDLPNDSALITSYLASLSKENRKFVLKHTKELALHLLSQQADG